MRRLLVLVLLLAGVQLVLPIGAGGHGGQWLLMFGFLIIAADAVGDLASAVRMPKVVGYLAAGIVFGPWVTRTVTIDATLQLAPVSSFAIALIAFLAGAELRWGELRDRAGLVAKILLSELGLALAGIALLIYLLRPYVPFMAGETATGGLALALLFASIAIVHSPAVTMALLTETRAGGPVARTTLGVVLVSDVAVILIFSAALAFTRVVIPPVGAESAALSFGTVVWEIGGAILVGAVLGGAIALYLRFVKRELFLFAMVVAFFGAELARLAHTEVLLTLLTAGFVTENVSRHDDGEAIRHAMERSAAPIFVVFFALAGAAINLEDIAALWPLVVPIVLVRLGCIWAGTAVGARWGRAQLNERKWVWSGLVAQAGVAIGLATVVAQAYPARGAQMRTLFLAVMAINQILGPILFKLALSRSGEIAEELTQELGARAPRQPAPSPAA